MLSSRSLTFCLVVGLSLLSSSAKADSFIGGYSSKRATSVEKLEKFIRRNNSNFIAMTRSCSSKGTVVRTVRHQEGNASACDGGQGKIITARTRGRELCSGGKSGPRCTCADTAVLCKKA